jgi:glycosyltransferase involved in cell wall biosynthesis
MRIVFDMQSAQTALSGQRGVGRYTRQLAKALVERSGEDEVIIALNGAFADTASALRSQLLSVAEFTSIRTWSSLDFEPQLYPEPSRLRQGNRAIREAFVKSLQPDFLFLSGTFEGFMDPAQTSMVDKGGPLPNGSMLYDLNPLKIPELLEEIQVRYWYQEKLSDLQTAQPLFTMSEAVRQDAINLLGYPAEKIVTIGTGVDAEFRKIDIRDNQLNRLLGRHDTGKPFVLYCGGYDPHKNVARLIEAAALSMRQLGWRFKLVFVGKIKAAQRLELERIGLLSGISLNELQFPGFLADEDLNILLNHCNAFVYPSLGEGFGLPVLEAMSAGAPVLCSNNSSLPEVLDFRDAMFDAGSASSIAGKLCHVLSDAGFASALREHGLRRAKLFNWHDTADKALAAIRSFGKREATARPVTPAGQVPVLPGLQDNSNRAGGRPEIIHFAYNRPSDGPGRLLVDVTFQNGGTPGSGIARVAARICQSLGEVLPPDLTMVPIAAVPGQPQFKVAKNFMVATGLNSDGLPENKCISLRSGDLFLALDLNHHLKPQGPFVERLQRLGGKSFAVVYDLLPLQRPDWFPPAIRSGHEDWIRQVTLFDSLLCISNAVAEDLRLYRKKMSSLHQRSDIGVFHLGSDLTAKADGEVPGALRVRPTILLVSVVYARKGHMQALKAFEQLWASGVDANIVFAGRKGWGADDFFAAIDGHPERDKRLFWFDGPNDGLLQRLYEACSGVLVASEGEGFGLPLVEAQARRKPVLARDLAVLREVSGDRVRYFRGLEPDDLAKALSSWFGDMASGSVLVDLAYKPLSWNQSAQQLLQAMGIAK